MKVPSHDALIASGINWSMIRNVAGSIVVIFLLNILADLRFFSTNSRISFSGKNCFFPFKLP
jgi:hypothetical protein